MSTFTISEAERAEAPDLNLDSGEEVLLSPGSSRFKSQYRQAHPRSAHELRDIVGVPVRAQNKGDRRSPLLRRSEVVPASDLSADDANVRSRAWAIADTSLFEFISSDNPRSLVQLEPLIAEYLLLIDAVVNVVVLADIEVADGGVLNVADETHVLAANRIILHGSARIACSGQTKLQVRSVEGVA